MNMVKPHSARYAVVLVTFFAISCKATAAENSPKATALAFIDGQLAGDLDKVMGVMALPDSDRSRAGVRGGLAMRAAFLNIDDACFAKFGTSVLGARAALVQLRRTVESGEFRIEGDKAVLVSGAPQDSVFLVRQGGRWKLSENRPADLGVYMAANQWMKYEQRVRDLGKKVSADVRAGNYGSCREAVEAATQDLASIQNGIMQEEQNCEPRSLREWFNFQKLRCVRPAYVCEKLLFKNVMASMQQDDWAKKYLLEKGAMAAATEVTVLIRHGRAEAGCSPDPDSIDP